MTEEPKPIVLSEQFDPVYREFWTTRKQYVVIKGSKGSGKSYVAALWIIFNMMKYPGASTLVVRKFQATIKDSIYAELKKAIHFFHADEAWRCNISPMEMVFTPDPSKPYITQKILFRGMDDPLKVASVTVDSGSLCWVLWEEASQITSEEDFDTVNMSIRGKLPPHLWKRVMVIFNPWSEKHWLKKKFFDEPDDRVLAMTTTYRNNPGLSEENIHDYEEIYLRNPRMARVVCDGEWGIAGGLVYEDWEEADFDINQVRRTYPNLRFGYGLDFGFVTDPTAFVALAVDELSRQIWIFDEMYEYGWDNMKVARQLTRMGYADKRIVADCAEQKSIYELKRGYRTRACDSDGDSLYDVDGHELTDLWVLPNVVPCMKGSDSVVNGIRTLQSYHIIIHRKCVNTLMEINNYAFEEDKDGALTNKPMDENNHCLVAGTLVLTDHGDIPIEDIKAGDMVMTHLGYREVIASGITRPEPAEIWRITLEDGTVLEGTGDHPIETTDGLKYIMSVSEGNEVIVCQKQEKMISRESSSNMMASDGTDIHQIPNQAQCTTATNLLSEEQPHISIGIFGKSTTGLFQKGTTSTTSTAIAQTTISQISNACHASTMLISTPSMTTEESSAPSACAGTLQSRMHAERGTPLRKGMSGTLSIPGKSQRRCNQKSLSASSAVQNIPPCPVELQNSVQTNANLRLEGLRELTTRREFVQSVAKHSQSTNMLKQGPVLENAPADCSLRHVCRKIAVKSVEKTAKKEFVYDLTVDEAHDFFANGILVLNCMDATRYTILDMLGSGKGCLVETSEDPVYVESDQHSIKHLEQSPRVYATYDDDDPREMGGLATANGLSLNSFKVVSLDNYLR